MDFLEYIQKNKSFVVFVVLLLAFVIVFIFAFTTDKNKSKEQKQNIVAIENKIEEEEPVKVTWIRKDFSQSADLENVSFTIEEVSFSEDEQSITFQFKNNDKKLIIDESFEYFVYDGNKKIILKNTETVPEDVLKATAEKLYGSNLRWNKFEYVKEELVEDDETNTVNQDTKTKTIVEENADKRLTYSTSNDSAIYKYTTSIDKTYTIEKEDIHVIVYNIKFKTDTEEKEKVEVATTDTIYDFKIDKKDLT